MAAIKAGTMDGSKGGDLVLLEGTGPDGIGFIIEIHTDNPKRCLPEIKKILGKAELIAGKEGCMSWLFDKRGVIVLPRLEQDAEILALEVGADEVTVDPADETALQFLCSADDFSSVKGELSVRRVVSCEGRMTEHSFVT
eukprot:m.159533 g.159533  ORF g.159533 m.159533 type:complete len:140 (-) comp53016_c0_seq21:247-666(-)